MRKTLIDLVDKYTKHGYEQTVEVFPGPALERQQDGT
jgi:hypothetical protein